MEEVKSVKCHKDSEVKKDRGWKDAPDRSIVKTQWHSWSDESTTQTNLQETWLS